MIERVYDPRQWLSDFATLVNVTLSLASVNEINFYESDKILSLIVLELYGPLIKTEIEVSDSKQ